MTDLKKKQVFPSVKGKRRKMAELLVNPDVNMTVKSMCDQIGVSRNTFYRWQNEPDFRGYVNYLLENYSDSELANVWKALTNKAKKGSTEAIKLYFELREKLGQNNNNESEKQSKMLEAIEKAVKNGNK